MWDFLLLVTAYKPLWQLGSRSFEITALKAHEEYLQGSHQIQCQSRQLLWERRGGEPRWTAHLRKICYEEVSSWEGRMSEQQDDPLIQRIRSYNWQTWQVRTVEPEYYWYGDGPEYLALAHENEEPLNSYPPATEEQLRQTEQLLGFPLPSFLRSLYMQVANGGFGPGFGVIGAIGGFPLMDGFGKDIAHGYLARLQRCTLIRLDPDEMKSRAQRYRDLKQLPADQVVGWDNNPLQLSAYPENPEWEQPYLYEFPNDVWPEGLLPLCYWGCAACSYIDVRTERIFQGFASDRRQHYLLVYRSASLEEWFERWMAGESLQ